MADRYFMEAPIQGDRARLEGPEAHHLLHVMRARPGDEVMLFDGTGAEFTARIEQTGRTVVELAVLSRTVIDRELSLDITVGVALPKGDRQKWLVEKLTELGAARLVPLETTRGVAQPQPTALERLRRSVVEASKQCRRNRLMSIDAPQRVEEFLAGTPADAHRWFAHPGSASITTEIEPLQEDSPIPMRLQIAIGPEGGFSDDERAAAIRAGWKLIGLGDRILRVETAAIALVATAALLSE